MADYQAMYRQLFKAQSQAIEILQSAQQQAEEMYMDSPDPAILIFDTRVANKSEEASKGYLINTLLENNQEGGT